ncbi:MAG: lmo0937 family membrane protein [Acidobacteriaceae bacterium]
MWLALAIILLVAWLIGFVAFHVTVFAIHILLVLFVIFLVIHFVRRARA